jgi:hypothetical protein
MQTHILTTSLGHAPIGEIRVKEGTAMSEELSAITATKQAKNVSVRCRECKKRDKVTVHVEAHDRYFWFDAPLDEVWPKMTEAHARVLRANKEYHFSHGYGHNQYSCMDCEDLRTRLMRKHINEEAENERL